MKRCNRCDLDKIENSFNGDICKTCFRKESKYNKTCNKCKNRKPISLYVDGSKICSDCINKDKLEILEGMRICSKCDVKTDINRFSNKSNIFFNCVNNDRYRRIESGLSKKYPTSVEKMKEWRKNNKEHLSEYRRKYSSNKYKNDIDYKLTVICRSFLRRCFYSKDGQRTHDILGYSANKLRQRLEFQFTEKMNWGNYGVYWNIDHRKPLSNFERNTPIYIINALSNLKPVIKSDNFSKQNRFIS